MRVLVIGGTVFLGRHVVTALMAGGHEITVFHRGRHGADLFAGEVERVIGDRRRHLGTLARRRWDLVVDTCGYVAADIQPLDADRYAFVSSASVYRDWPARAVDTCSAIWGPGAENAYGRGKAECEQRLEQLLPGRVVHLRAGVIVGPHENINRLPWWLERMRRGGAVLAPGPADAPLQWIDARDLAAFLLTAPPGVHNAVGPPGMATWGAVLEACARGTGAELVWVDGVAVRERVGEDHWSALPLWPAPAADVAGTYAVEASVAVRPVAATVADTRAWLDEGGRPATWREEVRATGLPAALEAALLAALR